MIFMTYSLAPIYCLTTFELAHKMTRHTIYYTIKNGFIFSAPIASPVRFARVQWKSFCAGVRCKRLLCQFACARVQRIAGTAPKKKIELQKLYYQTPAIMFYFAL